MANRRPEAEPFLVSRAICSRADLVRALAYADARLLADTAARLGFEARERPLKRDTALERVAFDTGSEQASITEWQLAARPLRALPFWQLVARELEDGPRLDAEGNGGSTEFPTWTHRPRMLATTRPLATWRELLPRLRRALAQQTETRTLDLPALVHRLSRGQSLERLPRQRRRRWGLSLHIIEDRSDHLAPYWGDQERVREQLVRLFPHYAVQHALWFEGLDAPLWADAEHSVGPYRPPPPGSLVVGTAKRSVLRGEKPGCRTQRRRP